MCQSCDYRFCFFVCLLLAWLACFNVCVCNLLLPGFSQVWAASFISLLLHLRLHLSDHLLHPPQLRETHKHNHTLTFTLKQLFISVQLVYLSLLLLQDYILIFLWLWTLPAKHKAGVKRRTHSFNEQ